jgi:hypothetical protein
MALPPCPHDHYTFTPPPNSWLNDWAMDYAPLRCLWRAPLDVILPTAKAFIDCRVRLRYDLERLMADIGLALAEAIENEARDYPHIAHFQLEGLSIQLAKYVEMVREHSSLAQYLHGSLTRGTYIGDAPNALDCGPDMKFVVGFCAYNPGMISLWA